VSLVEGEPTVVVVSGGPPAGARALRQTVFVRGQGVDAALEDDGRDADADHAVVTGPGGRVVATGRLMDPGPREPGAEPVGIIGRVAVDADWRRRGLGRRVTAALVERARERGLPAVELHAQLRVAGFYVAQGYRVIGEPDVEAGIEHVWMRRDLLPGLRPARDSDAGALRELIRSVWSEYPGCVLDMDGEERWLCVPGAAYLTGPGEPARRLWVVPADPAGADPAAGLLASVAVWQRGPGHDGLPGCGELKSLYVAAAARRRGLGTALVRRAEREAAGWGAPEMVLWTDTRFTSAHRLYRRLGYLPTGRSRELRDLSMTTEIEFCRVLPAEGRLRRRADGPIGRIG
jgi:predicted GNAT family N-acyltransferase